MKCSLVKYNLILPLNCELHSFPPALILPWKIHHLVLIHSFGYFWKKVGSTSIIALISLHHINILILHFLRIKVAPHIAPFDFGDEPANSGDSVSVNCLISSGDLPVDIEWLFNNSPINAYSGVSTSKVGKRVSVLTIDSVNHDHAGNYTCKARNHATTVNFTAELVINGISVIWNL